MVETIRTPWGIYNEKSELVHLGLHRSHIEAWLAYFGSGALPYGAIMEKTSAGWLACRVDVSVSNIIHLPKRPGVTKRDTIEIKEGSH